MVDCSHANSNKDHNRQPMVAREIARQIKDGNRSIMGLMIESNLAEGNQPLQADRRSMTYGVSVTDACINWDTTETLLKELALEIGPTLRGRANAPQADVPGG